MNKDDIVKYSATERLRDLRPVTIRTVRPDDKGLVIEALPGVSPESIQRRLFTSRKEITADDLKWITEIDFMNVAGLVALLRKEGHYHIVGRGRYIRSGASVYGQRAEAAFLAEDAFQGLVIASLIFRHLVTIAGRSGITEFEAEVLPTNEAMQKVFTREVACPSRELLRAIPSIS